MEISAIILAGGRSSRMGTNKAMLPLAGTPVIERLITQLQEVANHIVIAGGAFETYRQLGVEVVPDYFPEQGPLSGIHAGLTACHSPWCLVVACDMPFANQKVFQQLYERCIQEESDKYQAIVPVVEGRVQPLLAAYRQTVIPNLTSALKNGQLKMTQWVEQLETQYVDGLELSAEAGLTPDLLQFNMNKPNDYEYAKGKFDSDVNKLSKMTVKALTPRIYNKDIDT